MAIFDGKGDLHTTIAEMDIADHVTPAAIANTPAAAAALRSASIVVVDGNVAVDTIDFVAEVTAGRVASLHQNKTSLSPITPMTSSTSTTTTSTTMMSPTTTMQGRVPLWFEPTSIVKSTRALHLFTDRRVDVISPSFEETVVGGASAFVTFICVLCTLHTRMSIHSLHQ
jgi:hypothetical protein